MPSPFEFGLSKAAYGVNDAANQLGLGRTTLYALVKSGRLRSTKVGHKTIFLAVDIAAFLGALRQENA